MQRNDTSTVIRPFRLLDAARRPLRTEVGRRDRVYTLDALLSGGSPTLSVPEAVRLTVPPGSRSVCSLAWVESNKVNGLACARQRSGPSAWELKHLLFGVDDEGGQVGLLERVCQAVARRGGEKVFIRVRADDPLTVTARKAGFVSSTNELLFARRHTVHHATREFVRTRTRSDGYGLFRLYNASTPVEVRTAVGMTFEQWSASMEPSRARPAELVYEREGQLRGWLRVTQGSKNALLSLMSGGEQGADAETALVDTALELVAEGVTAHCLVPEYQASLSQMLSDRGFEMAGEYVTLVRSMAVAARQEEKARTAITTAPT